MCDLKKLRSLCFMQTNANTLFENTFKESIDNKNKEADLKSMARKVYGEIRSPKDRQSPILPRGSEALAH